MRLTRHNSCLRRQQRPLSCVRLRGIVLASGRPEESRPPAFARFARPVPQPHGSRPRVGLLGTLRRCPSGFPPTGRLGRQVARLPPRQSGCACPSGHRFPLPPVQTCRVLLIALRWFAIHDPRRVRPKAGEFRRPDRQAQPQSMPLAQPRRQCCGSRGWLPLRPRPNLAALHHGFTLAAL